MGTRVAVRCSAAVRLADAGAQCLEGVDEAAVGTADRHIYTLQSFADRGSAATQSA
jgi:hypothetical protein